MRADREELLSIHDLEEAIARTVTHPCIGLKDGDRLETERFTELSNLRGAPNEHSYSAGMGVDRSSDD